MKKSYIKKIKKCFGVKKHLLDESITECERCQFRKKCLKEVIKK